MKKFFNADSSRDPGTLSHFKALLRRTNVNGNVKATNGFESHRDFIFTVARWVHYKKDENYIQERKLYYG